MRFLFKNNLSTNPKIPYIMIKIFQFIGLVAIAVFILFGVTTCKKDADSDKESTKNYLSVEGASYLSGPIPSASSGSSVPEVTNVTGNSSVIEGGSNPITVYASVPVTKIYIAVQNANGYYMYAVSSSGTVYTLSLVLSTDIPTEDFVILIAIVNNLGQVSAIYEVPVSIIEVGTGQLQVSLSWDKPNDVDLHLVEPDGEEIYYGNDYSSNGGFLDLDSNPACAIDGIQNENITYDETSYVETGNYIVRVDLYSGCSVSEQTNYIVTARLNGELILNPFNGTFPSGASGDYGGAGSGIPVMQFTLSGNNMKSAGTTTFRVIRFPSARESASISDKKAHQ
jgi:hypothetical protein